MQSIINQLTGRQYERKYCHESKLVPVEISIV